MNKFSIAMLFLGLGLVITLPAPSSAQTQACNGLTFSSNQVFSSCNDLPRLSSYLYWNYHATNQTADIAFRKTPTSTSNWVAWALNPSGQRMAGSQALVAYQQSNGTMIAYTAPVSASPTMQPGSLSFGVSNLRAEYSNGEMIIFATLQLDNTLLSTNQVWQEGPLSGGSPSIHPTSGDNMQSVGTVDFATGTVTSTGGGISSRARRRNVHGLLNGVGWGVLMPIGAITARYLKVFKAADPAWYYLHISCQVIAYALGVAGWGTGLKLGSDSPGIKYSKHRNIGIALFSMATLQVCALLAKPKPDNKYRIYWKFYHHSIGYAIIVLSIVNIFEGFDVLNGQNNWKKAYIGIIIALGAIALILETFTWLIVVRREKSETTNKHLNGTNGVNGYATTAHA
ncbi:hypothetical protein Tsubulata_048874 [Turnera subulata]|uniref:Cytochrome b561 and DOMON domain-containing protein n=1 Tax=Turnera subulata TaxID=218843 RepID=A0A9Q0JBA0_9ROSI|nr:hypothetical protein Tsubulata_048874 [Turnera subulata]